MPSQPAQSAEPTPEQSLAAAYEIAELDTPSPAPASQAQAPVSTPALPQPKPRDPTTGKFLSPAEVTGEPETTHSHPDWLFQQAADLGISQEEIESTPTDILGRTVRATNNQLLKQAREDARVQVRDQSDRRPTATVSPPEPEESPLANFDFGTDEAGVKLTEKSYDQGIMKLFKEQASQIKNLQRQVAELSTREVQRENLTGAQKIDKYFASLNDPRFGTMGHEQLKSDSVEYRRRVAVLREAADLAGPKATQAEAFAKIGQAIQNIYGEPAPVSVNPAPSHRRNGAPARKDEDLATWEAAGLARPTQRIREPEPKGVKKAERSVANRMRDLGQPTEEDDNYDNDFLPG